MRLGVNVKMAINCGTTSKGPWRSAKTFGINEALLFFKKANDYLKKAGLESLRDGWMSFITVNETPCAICSCIALPSKSI